MSEEIRGTPKIDGSKGKGPIPGRSVDKYAAQCEKCLKWRIIEVQEEYEEIRSNIQDAPFVCRRKEGVSCEDPADLEFDSSRTWAIDKPGIPKTPSGFKRSLVLRKDYSKMDAYYIAPTGKKMRTKNEVAAFIEANPEYSDASLAQFAFTVPKVLEETVPSSAVNGSPGDTADKNGKDIEES